MVLISHLIVPIEWVPYPQKECRYSRMTLYSKILTHTHVGDGTKTKLWKWTGGKGLVKMSANCSYEKTV